MKETGTELVTVGRKDELKMRVLEVMLEVMNGIDDGTVDYDMVADLFETLIFWMSGKGQGLCPIYAPHWQKLLQMKGGQRAEITEMIHHALDYYSVYFWAQEPDDAD
jgi:hypothetical protein